MLARLAPIAIVASVRALPAFVFMTAPATSYRNQKNVMYGPYQGSVAQSVYNSASTR
jgi:hypothetical protein